MAVKMICVRAPRFRGFLRRFTSTRLLERGLKQRATNAPKNTAALMPPAVAASPPVNAPISPLSCTLNRTP